MIIDGSRDREGNGEWSQVLPWSIIPLHSIVLPDGNVLSFGTTEQGMQGGQFVYDLWDPVTNVHSVLPNTTAVNMFCSNMAIDPATGNVIIMGGDGNGNGGGVTSGINDVVVFDYKTRTIRDAEQGDMDFARWYGSTVTLPNGEILILGGRDENYLGSTIPEIFNPETGFRQLTGADMPDLYGGGKALDESWWYPHMWVDSAGDVIVIEAQGDDIYRLTTDGQGTVEKIGKLPFEAYKLNASIMFDEDKVAIIGDDAGIWVGDLSQDVPQFTRVAEIENARINAGMTVLPDGRVAITGGSGGGDQGNDLGKAVYNATIWDPATNAVTPMADQALARLYHASSLILPDGTVFSGGGGAPGPLTNTNAEVFMPDYLYGADGVLADRPEILAAPKNVGSFETFRFTVDDAAAVETVSMTKSGAMTHARNSDARFFQLDFTVIDATTIEVTTLAPTLMTPGLWMLTTADAAGVPSVASLVGVAMADLVETEPLIASTEAYNNEIEQIDGPFALTVEARFDDIDGGRYQRVFDFGNGAAADNIWLGQVADTATMAFEIIRDGTAYRITAPGAIVEGEIATWGVQVDAGGRMQLSKNGTVLAGGQGVVPADVERILTYFGDSNFTADSRLFGMVRNLDITQAGQGDGGAEAPSYAIDGAFTANAEARFDDIDGGRFQRVFDFSNGPDTNNIWLGQIGNTADMAFEIIQEGVKYRIVAPGAIVEGERATWTVSADETGRLRLFRDGELLAEGDGVVPANVDRTKELVGRSAYPTDTPLIGEVSVIGVVAGFVAPDVGPQEPGDPQPEPEGPGDGETGGDPVNVIVAAGGYVEGTDGDDRFEGGSADDSFFGGAGDDVFMGGGGYNQTDYAGRSSDYRFARNGDGSVSVTDKSGETDTLIDIDGFWFRGESRWYALDDLVPATPDPRPEPEPEPEPEVPGDGGGDPVNVIVAAGGYVEGTDGDDRFEGGSADDSFFGGAGDDVFIGGGGYNQTDYAGRSGDYTFARNSDGSISVTDKSGETDTLVEIDGFWFRGEGRWYALDDLVPATPDPRPEPEPEPEVPGDGGGDGGDPVNVIVAAGGYVEGTDGDDRFEGGSADDSFFGGAGEDVFIGGGGYNQTDYAGRSGDYTFARNSDGSVSVTDKSGETDTLVEIDGFWFRGEGRWYALDDLVGVSGPSNAAILAMSAAAAPDTPLDPAAETLSSFVADRFAADLVVAIEEAPNGDPSPEPVEDCAC